MRTCWPPWWTSCRARTAGGARPTSPSPDLGVRGARRAGHREPRRRVSPRGRGSAPPGVEDPAPVVPGDGFEVGVAEAGVAQSIQELGQTGDVVELVGDPGAVEVRAERHVAHPDALGDIRGVLRDDGEGSVGVVLEVGANELAAVDDA